MRTAFTYSRFSSHMQNEASIEAQQDAIAIYAARHGIQIVAQYADHARSGLSDNRPEFQRMIGDLKRNPVDLVLVHKIDRFARNRYDAAVYTRMIADRGAKLICVAQDFGDGPEAIILEGLMQAMAEYYSANLSSEIKKGKKIRAKRGQYSGGIAPLGYRADESGNLQIVPAEAHFIRALYEAACAGKPFAPIIRRMDSAGIRGRLGAALTSRNVSDMLRRITYTGTFRQVIDGEVYEVENHHPAIITKDVYKEACSMLDQKASAGRASQHHEYICSGLLRCGACASPLSGNSRVHNGRTYVYYNCKSRCGMRGVSAPEIERACVDYVCSLLNPQVRAQLSESLAAYTEGQAKAVKRRAPEAKREIRKLRSEIDALLANMSAGVLPPSVLAALGEQISQKEARIELLEALAETPPSVTSVDIDEYFAGVSSLSLSDDPDHIRRTLARFIEQVLVFPDRFEFTSTLDSFLRAHLPPPPDDDPTPDGSHRRRSAPTNAASEADILSNEYPASSCPPCTASSDTPAR